MTHSLPGELLERPIRIHLAGCGGNGSQMLTGLARLDRALRACGHPGGLKVVAFDPDRVSEANVGRQLFAPADAGQNKAAVLVFRLNCFFGLDWEASDHEWKPDGVLRPWAPGMHAVETPDVLISCVDTAKARREMHQALALGLPRVRYWLDLGNTQDSGQVVLGQPGTGMEPRVGSARGFRESGASAAYERGTDLRLPTVMEVFPELLDAKRKEDNRPSCSLAEALESQDLFVNDFIVNEAKQLLWTLLRRGKIDYHGAFVNLRTGEHARLPIAAPSPALLPAETGRRVRTRGRRLRCLSRR